MQANFSIGPTGSGLRAAYGATTNIGLAIRAMHRAVCAVGWADRPDGVAPRVHVDFGPPYTPVARVIAAVDAESSSFVACFDLGPAVEPERLESAIRFATLANAALLNGCFDVDMNERTVHFRTGVVFGKGELSEEVVIATLSAAVSIINSHAAAFLRAVHDDVESP